MGGITADPVHRDRLVHAATHRADVKPTVKLGKRGNSATRQASARELLSKVIPLARAVAMQEATTNAEEEETPAAGGTVPLMAILRRRGGLC